MDGENIVRRRRNPLLYVVGLAVFAGSFLISYTLPSGKPVNPSEPVKKEATVPKEEEKEREIVKAGELTCNTEDITRVIVEKSREQGLEDLTRLLDGNSREAWAYVPGINEWAEVGEKHDSTVISQTREVKGKGSEADIAYTRRVIELEGFRLDNEDIGLDKGYIRKLIKEHDSLAIYFLHPKISAEDMKKHVDILELRYNIMHNSGFDEKVPETRRKFSSRALESAVKEVRAHAALPAMREIRDMAELSFDFYNAHPDGNLQFFVFAEHGIVEFSLSKEAITRFKEGESGIEYSFPTKNIFWWRRKAPGLVVPYRISNKCYKDTELCDELGGNEDLSVSFKEHSQWAYNYFLIGREPWTLWR